MKPFTKELIESHYSAKGQEETYPDRIRQINISVSIDTYAMLKVQAEHFGESLSSFCANELYDFSFDVLKEVSEIRKSDADLFIQNASLEAEEEAQKQGLKKFDSYWNLVQKWKKEGKFNEGDSE